MWLEDTIKLRKSKELDQKKQILLGKCHDQVFNYKGFSADFVENGWPATRIEAEMHARRVL